MSDEGTYPTREDMRECTLQCYDELHKEHGRPPTMKEILDLTGVPIHFVRAFLGVASKRLTDGRQLRS